MDDFIVQKHQNIFFVCVYEDNVLHMYWCHFQISSYMGKKVKLEKIVPSVLDIHVSQYSVIHCHRNTILHSLNSP